jgi:hypothetical protein
MNGIDGDEILKGIRANMRASDDTLYCHPRQLDELLLEVFETQPTSTDNLKISGLQVRTHPMFEFPIVCEKGDVFGTAGQYQSGERQATEL